jgi:hypothetical protein
MTFEQDSINSLWEKDSNEAQRAAVVVNVLAFALDGSRGRSIDAFTRGAAGLE